MALEVQVHRGRCIATKACLRAAPATFALDPAEVAVVSDPNGDPEDAVIEAAEACPTGAISVYRDGVKLV